MPRALRVLIEGGLYHVYNRFARGEEAFADPGEAIEFIDLLRDLKQRDDLQIFAWSLLSNHFHLAVRTAAVPLSRTMRTLQGGFARAFNRRWGDPVRCGKPSIRRGWLTGRRDRWCAGQTPGRGQPLGSYGCGKEVDRLRVRQGAR